MPTITFALKDLNKLVGRSISVHDLESLVEFGKGELEGYDKESDEVKINFDDTNLPYLWSVEGFAVLLKGVFGIEKGIPKMNVFSSDDSIIVESSVNDIRPFIAAFSVRGSIVDDYLIKQIIQLQEKLCESYGRKRKTVAIGVYSYKKIRFPVYYRAVDPESIEFVPLEFRRSMTLKEILETHPTGIKYAFTLDGFDKYPLLIDSQKKVLSFPPIINSEDLGKVVIGDSDLFVEVTGTDINHVNLCANIIASAFNERGFRICNCSIQYPDCTRKTPLLATEKIVFSKEDIKGLLGIIPGDSEVKRYLEMSRYNCSRNLNNFEVEVPWFRRDVLHKVDLIEDIAIMRGFNNFPDSKLSTYTVGKTDDFTVFVDNAREILVGLGLQEIMSAVLFRKEELYEKMNLSDFGTVEIKEFMSINYSVVRSWLVPALLKFLSLNKHNEYPQNIFEQGVCVLRNEEKIEESERISVCLCDHSADFTRIKQIVDCLIRGLGFEFISEERIHLSFITGRVAVILINNVDVGFIGELHPQVLDNWDISMPVACFELNLTSLFMSRKKRQ